MLKPETTSIHNGKSKCRRSQLVEDSHLDKPNIIVAVEPVLAYPCSKDVPFHGLSAINRDPVLCVLVLGLFEIRKYLLCQLCQESAVEQVVLWDGPSLGGVSTGGRSVIKK
jgi:hypothetical protein